MGSNAPANAPPKLVFTFKEDPQELPVSENFRHFCGFVQDYSGATQPESQPEYARIPLPESDQFDIDDVRTVMCFTEEIAQSVPELLEKPYEEKDLVGEPPKWATDFFDRLDRDELFGALNAAQFLCTTVFVANAAAYIACQLDTKTVPEMREYLGIEPDFSDDEWASFLRVDYFRKVIDEQGITNTPSQRAI